MQSREIIKSTLSTEEMSKIFSAAIADENLISEEDTAVIFYNVDFLNQRVENLKDLFPKNTLHAVAIKANPLTKILNRLMVLGVGLEAASLPELYLAETAGFPPNRIVFDSPAKTKQEIEYALKLGVHINADSFDELNRIGEILKTVKSTSTIGVRVNPQIVAGNIESTSVAGIISKFGIPLSDHEERLKRYFLKYNWISGVHVHIGSQGYPVAMLIKGIRKVLDFTLAINKTLQENGNKNLIETFDIGGGLPVSYHTDGTPVSMESYLSMLRENCREL